MLGYDQGPVAAPSRRFGRNQIEVAPISSALLRIACLVILYKTLPCVSSRWGIRTSIWGIRIDMRTRAQLLRKCLAIRRLLTEFFPPIVSARQESNRAHGSLERHRRPDDEPRPTRSFETNAEEGTLCQTLAGSNKSSMTDGR